MQESVNSSLLVSASIGHHQKVLQHYRGTHYMYAIFMSLYRDLLPLNIKISYIKLLLKLIYEYCGM
jgi:hypothetical protein